MAACWRRLTALPDAWFALILSGLVLARSGASFRALDARWANQCVAAFPALANNFRCHNALPWLLPWLLGVDSDADWHRLQLALTTVALLGSLGLVRLRYAGAQFRAVAVWLALSAMPVALLQPRVSYDVYSLFAGSLLVLGRGPWLVAAGGLTLGLCHPEQALVAIASLAAVSAALGRLKESRTKWAVLACMVGVAATKLHGLTAAPPGEGRAEILGRSLGKALFQAGETGTMGLYACYGLAWLLVLTWLVAAPLSMRSRTLLAVGLVGLPGVATLITLDGTRVFVGGAWPAFLLFVTSLCERELGERAPPDARGGMLRTITCMALLLALVTPAYVMHGARASRPRWGSALRSLVHLAPWRAAEGAHWTGGTVESRGTHVSPRSP